MSFLAPLFLVALASLAIPVVIHLVQRERKHVVPFPSLMFLRRIPYQSVRRRRIRQWLLLLLRAAALALIVAAFARPVWRGGPAAGGGPAGAREVVVLLDTSASMAYGDHWARAQTAANRAVDGLGPEDRATIVLFARNAEERVRATTDRARLKASLQPVVPGSGATHFGPALKLAQSILSRSAAPRREAVLISDFQKSGWSGSEDVRFPEGTVLTPVSVASEDTANLSVASVTFGRATFSDQERVTVTAGLANHGGKPAADVEVSLEIDGRNLETQRTTVAPGASASVSFAPFTLTDPNVRGTVRAGSDGLARDNAFHFVLSPDRPLSVLVVDSGIDQSVSFYLARALAVGRTPTFKVDVLSAARVTPASFDNRAVVVLNDVTIPPAAAAGGLLDRFVQRGGGLLIVLGDRSSWSATQATLLPGRTGPIVDRRDGRGAALGFLDYSHPVFELFKAPHSGDFSAARIVRYRSLEPAPGDRVLARFDDGAVAAAERRVGGGRVIAWTTTVDDSWNDVALKPVYLPLVHQLIRYLAQYQEPSAWRTVGQALDVSAAIPASRGDRTVLTPDGQRIVHPASARAEYVELEQQGFYEVRIGDVEERRPFAVAVDLDPAESDLAALDPQELVAAVLGHATSADATTPAPVTIEDTERRQAVWWYLLLAGVCLLVGETIVSNRISLRV